MPASRLVDTLTPDCVGYVANGLSCFLKGVLLYLPPLLLPGFIYFLFEVYIPVNHELLLARLTLV